MNQRRILLWLALCLVCLCAAFSSSVTASKKKQSTAKFVFVDGDVIIGGLSPVHFSPIDESGLDPDAFACQGEFNPRGFEAVEAMLFTMDMLNHGHLKDAVLPNITIGMDIKETCTTADNALRESLKFSFIRNVNRQEKCSGEAGSKAKQTKTVAVVGAAYSGVSMAVTNLCGLFYVPLVSYASTSRLLSNKLQFRYFFRTVPSDMLQAQVMADLVKAMNWNYVITLASDTEYGRSGIEAFNQATHRLLNYHICIPVDETFTKRSDEKTFDKIFAKMKKHPKAKVVILFAELHDAQILIDKIRDRNLKEKYIWIGSDAWADSKEILKANEAILNGMFAIVPEVRKMDKFVQYFVNFNEERRKRNPWMQEYEDMKVAHDPAFHRQTFQHYSKAPYVMDAVLSTAYALHDVLGCKPYKDCSHMKYKMSFPNFQKDFVARLEKVRFPAMSRDFMYFNDAGDAIGIYDIKHLKLVKENYEYLKIGVWGTGNCDVNSVNASLDCLKLDKDLIDERLMEYDKVKDVNYFPFSRCSATCPPGYHKVADKDFSKCCWSCRKCAGNTISNKSNSDECSICPRGYWPNKVHSQCETIQPQFIKWTDPAALIITVSIGIGVLAVIATFLVFFFYGETPVVKASSRELCYVLLLGILWCYATPILYILEPTETICRIMPYATGLCPSLVVGTLLTKTNRISRIFNRKLNQSGAPACLSKKWQVLMVVCIAIVEIIICSVYTVSSDTGRTVITFESKNEVIIKCKSMPDIWVAVWWAYIVGLVVTCTYQAYLTRKLPENYNEAKFITFTMLITCIVVIMFIPTYIGTSGVYRTVISCFVFIIGGSAALGCIFVPKLYIILWRPEKNVPMRPRSHSVMLGTISPSTSFIRHYSTEYNADVHPRHWTRHCSIHRKVDDQLMEEIPRSRASSMRRSASVAVSIFRTEASQPTLIDKKATSLIVVDRFEEEDNIESNLNSDKAACLPLEDANTEKDGYREVPCSESRDDKETTPHHYPRRKLAVSPSNIIIAPKCISPKLSTSLNNVSTYPTIDAITTCTSERNLRKDEETDKKQFKSKESLNIADCEWPSLQSRDLQEQFNSQTIQLPDNAEQLRSESRDLEKRPRCQTTQSFVRSKSLKRLHFSIRSQEREEQLIESCDNAEELSCQPRDREEQTSSRDRSKSLDVFRCSCQKRNGLVILENNQNGLSNHRHKSDLDFNYNKHEAGQKQLPCKARKHSLTNTANFNQIDMKNGEINISSEKQIPHKRRKLSPKITTKSNHVEKEADSNSVHTQPSKKISIEEVLKKITSSRREGNRANGHEVTKLQDGCRQINGKIHQRDQDMFATLQNGTSVNH